MNFFKRKQVKPIIIRDDILQKICEELFPEPIEKEEDGNSGEELSAELQGPMVDVTKWELVNKMIDTILDEIGEEDPTLGKKNLEKLSTGFKLAYNTLLQYNIIIN